MNYVTLETDIVTRMRAYPPLTAIVSTGNINPLPDTETDFTNFEKSGMNPKIAVCFGAGEVSPNRNSGSYVRTMYVVVQDEDITVNIIVAGRRKTEIYNALEMVKKAIIGYTPTNCGKKMYLIAEQLVQRENAIWTFNMRFGTQTEIVEDDSVNPVIATNSAPALAGAGSANLSGPPMAAGEVIEPGFVLVLGITAI